MKNKYLISQLGFTVTELLIALVIMGIAMGIGMPNFRGIVSSQRLTSTANLLASSLQLARSEAAKRNKNVGIVPKINGEWNTGWIMFVDKNNNETRNEDELILKEYDAVPSLTIISKGLNSSLYTPFYTPSGRVNGIAGSFIVCTLSNSKSFRKITIANTGRVRVEKPKNSEEEYSNNCPQM